MTGNGSPWRARGIVAALAFAAYLPSLGGGFVYDDDRFIEKNVAVHELSPTNLVRYFADPTTLASVGHEGIYRPLRTLDFAIDWAISGGRPWFFHLRNVLYHVLASALAFEALRRLLRGAGPALFGALAFALHPVNVESVAWVTSRGDALLLVTFLLALVLHLDGRWKTAAGMLVVSLFSKESAVVFPAAALLVDVLRREPLRWVRYATYAALAAGFAILWLVVMREPSPARVGHLEHYWGGTYLSNLLTMAKGFLYYAKLILVPTELVIDYHVPPTVRLDAGAAAAIGVLLAMGIAALVAGRRSRFALLWFAVTILPVSNLVRPIGIPTAERFLYLPLFGVVLWAGPILARWRVPAAVALSCLFALTFARTFDWRSNDTLWVSAERVAVTPRSLGHRSAKELELAHAAKAARDRALPSERREHHEAMARHAERACRAADELIRLYEEVLLLPPGTLGGRALSGKANALLLLGRDEEALDAADRAIRLDAGPEAYFNAAVALERLDRKKEAALNLREAADLWEEQGDPGRAARARSDAARLDR